MMRTSRTVLLFSALAMGLSSGCDRGEKKQAGVEVPTGSGVPQVGLPHATKEQYKPVVGKYGGRIVQGQMGEPKSFNPIVMSETSTSDYTMRMFEGLTRLNMFTGEVEPGIAESWEVAPDGLTWTFKLRKDVKFNDGSPFTSEDVAFTWNDLMFDNNRPADKAEPRWPASFRDITTIEGKQIKCEAVDAHTVRFITPSKFAILPQIVGNQFFCSKKKYAPLVANGTFGGAMSTDAKPGDIVSTGPWMFSSYSRGERVILKRNPHYWRRDAAGQSLPYLDELVFLISASFDTMFLQFDRKEIDIYQCYRGGKDISDLRPKQEKDNFKLYQLGPEAGDTFLTLNMNSEAAKKGKLPEYKVNWFRDKRFRQAISHAVDRTAIVRNIYRNLGHPQYSTESLGDGPFTTPVEPIALDLNKSKALLADMGLKDRNGDGIIEDEQGHKVQFTIITNSGNVGRQEMSNYIATDLRKIGMEVNPLFLEFNQIIDRLDVSYDWEAIVISFTSMWDPHWGANFWNSNSTNHLWWPKQKEPGFPWEKQIDDIFARGIQELDVSKRKTIYAELTNLAREEQPIIFLAVRERVDAIRNKFGNLFPSGYTLWEFASLHNEDELFLLDNPTAAAR
jgi:peptide/nickel transport system substrate-binding protein